jgi:hypothetical protein
LAVEGVAEGVVESGVGGLEGQGAAEEFGGGSVLVGLEGDEGQEIKGVGVVGVLGEELLAEGGGGGEAAGLVVPAGEGEDRGVMLSSRLLRSHGEIIPQGIGCASERMPGCQRGGGDQPSR